MLHLIMQQNTMTSQYEDASKMLQEKKAQLITALLEKGGGIPFLKSHTRILDDYFCESFEKSMIGPRIGINKNPYAIIALGGYGREEQSLHSDVDLLFLFKNRIPQEAEALICEILYPLWDLRLDIGYATRTLKDCISLANKEHEVLTSLLDARFICGMSLLYSEMIQQIREKVIFKKSDKIVAWLVESNQHRHQNFGDATYLLEPNLKEGQGGLRDYHTMLWLAQIRLNIKHPRDLEYNGCLSHDEFETLTQSLSFIWNVRSRLHHFIGRKYDQLHFEYQPELAKRLDYKDYNGERPVERFLGELHSQMEFVKQKHQMFLCEFGGVKKWFHIRRRAFKPSDIIGLEVQKDMLNFTTPEDILKSHELLIQIFQESLRLRIPLNIEAKRLIKEFAYLIDDNFRSSKSVVKIFEHILLSPAPTFNVLNEMLHTGFLVKFIPEFRAIVNRIEYDEYHVFPVDKHSLRTVRTVKQFGTEEDPTRDGLCGKLYKEISQKKVLLWAALLHDIGKGSPGENHSRKGAEIAQTILTEKGLRQKDIETVSFLIQEHLFLIHTATRRDINDEETVIFCARKIQDIERLKMLYLLTVADFVSTGPKAWNDWVSVLLQELFFKVLKILEKGDLSGKGAMEILETKKEECKKALNSLSLVSKNAEELLNAMSPRYLLDISKENILVHIGLYLSMNQDDFVWNITKEHDADTRRVTICAKERSGFFSKVAGIFTLHGINVLEAQSYTWNNHVSIHIFRVSPPPDQLFEAEKWKKAEKELQSALSEKLDLTSALNQKFQKDTSFKIGKGKEPSQILIDNESSSFFTIIEVIAYDFPGLLFRITDALFRCDLRIQSAQVATKVDQVVDVFYVRDADDEKADTPEQVETIRTAIDEVLSI